MADITLSHYQEGDRDDLLAVYNSSLDSKRRRGDETWGGRVFTLSMVADFRSKGSQYIARDADGRAVGAVVLRSEDVEVWGADDVDALYVYKFAVHQSFQGKGIGSAMLDAIDDIAKRESRTRVRLDCFAHNKGLVRYYADRGFAPRGIASFGSGSDWLRYEKIL